MKRHLIFTLLVVAFSLQFSKVNAQFSVDTKIEDLYRVNLINPGISIEKRIINYSTVQANIYWSTTLNTIKSSSAKQYTLFLDPSINIQYRYYHNYYRRADLGKNVANNGANFMGGLIERTVTRFPLRETNLVEKARPVLKLGAMYGAQRTLFNYVLIEGYVGFGYQWETKSMETSDGKSTKYQSGAMGIFTQLNIGIPVL